jgi:hypothetical protein
MRSSTISVMDEKKAPPQLTEPELLECVHESGFPFELQVARELASLGFDVSLSHRFFDRAKNRDAEIDILATDSRETQTKSGKTVYQSLRVAVECRDSSQPLVFFGLPNIKPETPPDKMDPDWRYCWIDTSRDAGIPNKFAAIAFDEARSELFRKKFHYQFNGLHRFSTVTTVEWQNKRPKLHVTDRLRSTLSNFGAFADGSRATTETMTRSPREFERMMGGMVWLQLTFLLVVHAGKQYQYSSEEQKLRPTTRTSVFNAFHSGRGVQFIVIDFVRSDSLVEANTSIRNTYGLLLDHVAPTVLASPAG